MKNKQIYSESTRRETVSVANTLKKSECKSAHAVNLDIVILSSRKWLAQNCHRAIQLPSYSPVHVFFFTIQSYFSRLTISFKFEKWPNIYIKDQLNILTEPGLRLDQNQFRCILPLQYSVITYVMLTGRHVCIKRSQCCREEKWIALI